MKKILSLMTFIAALACNNKSVKPENTIEAINPNSKISDSATVVSDSSKIPDSTTRTVTQ
ncbi:MAG: hypothetical protein ICV66_09220 [Chitinophagaceae bacterium]|nr:hypothetical protein [Chitinophagaceae bacterium]